MYQALSLLEELSLETTDWLLSVGTERSVEREEAIIVEGQELADIFVVLDGLFSVHVRGTKGPLLAVIGPGELIGEISFLQRSPATAHVIACEKSRVLCLARLDLEGRIKANHEFAADLYRGLARVLARRLRERSATLSETIKTTEGLNGIGAWRDFVTAMEEFKEMLQPIGDAGRSSDDGIPDDLAKELHVKFNELCHGLSRLTREIENKEILDEAEIILRREFAPYIHLTQMARRALAKPRGYAGDFLTINMMYEDCAGGVPPLGPVIDDLFLKRPCCRAVQNRRGLLAEEIGLALARNDGSARVTSLACGPAAEVFDAFRGGLPKLKVTLIDIDFQALAFVAERREKAGLTKRMRLEHANLVYLATGRQVIDINDQHLVYSSGLIDYFADQFVIALLDWIHNCLAPGGKVVLGNFHPRNPDRALMELVLDWKLIHRSEEDMHRLFKTSKFGRSCTEIRYERERINLFACCTKAS